MKISPQVWEGIAGNNADRLKAGGIIACLTEVLMRVVDRSGSVRLLYVAGSVTGGTPVLLLEQH